MGCASSFPEDIDENLYKPEEGTNTDFKEYIVKFHHSDRNIVSWVPFDHSHIRASILLSHGLHEHARRYAKVAHKLASEGFAVFGIDHVGHGLSAGPPGLIENYETMSIDFAEFATYIRENYVFTNFHPMFIFAHSMGTFVATLALKNIPDITAAIISATPIVVGPSGGSPFGLKALYPMTKSDAALNLAKTLATVNPQGPAAPILLDALTSDQEEINDVKNDPRHYNGSIKNKTAYELLKMTSEVKKELSHVSLPFLCIHGELDTIALPEGSTYFYENAATPVGDKRIEFIPNCLHEALFEREDVREGALVKIFDFMKGFIDIAIARKKEKEREEAGTPSAVPVVVQGGEVLEDVPLTDEVIPPAVVEKEVHQEEEKKASTEEEEEQALHVAVVEGEEKPIEVADVKPEEVKGK